MFSIVIYSSIKEATTAMEHYETIGWEVVSAVCHNYGSCRHEKDGCVFVDVTYRTKRKTA